MDINTRLDKAEKLIYGIRSKKDFDRLITALDKLKFSDCPLANTYINILIFTGEFKNKNADFHIKKCPICYLISLVIVAKEENWSLDDLRSYYVKYIREGKN